jgi:hypothetical protein
MQKTIENRSVGGVVAGPPVAMAAGRGPGAGRLLAFGATLTLVIAAFALMLWLTSDPVRREAVEGLVRSPFGLLVLFGLSAISTATLILPAPGLAHGHRRCHRRSNCRRGRSRTRPGQSGS